MSTLSGLPCPPPGWIHDEYHDYYKHTNTGAIVTREQVEDGLFGTAEDFKRAEVRARIKMARSGPAIITAPDPIYMKPGEVMGSALLVIPNVTDELVLCDPLFPFYGQILNEIEHNRSAFFAPCLAVNRKVFNFLVTALRSDLSANIITVTRIGGNWKSTDHSGHDDYTNYKEIEVVYRPLPVKFQFTMGLDVDLQDWQARLGVTDKVSDMIPIVDEGYIERMTDAILK